MSLLHWREKARMRGKGMLETPGECGKMGVPAEVVELVDTPS